MFRMFGGAARKKMVGVRGEVLPNGVPSPLIASMAICTALTASIVFKFFTNAGGKSEAELLLQRTRAQREIQAEMREAAAKAGKSLSQM
eukprot:SAG31_NODE_4879_length_2888_cov_1.855145_4_plen_89_part_00